MVRAIDVAAPATITPFEFGRMLRLRRLAIPLTLLELAARSGISSSHIGRIERGERFPSAKALLRLACHLQYTENELFTLAGYLTTPGQAGHKAETPRTALQLDPHVARVLAGESLEIQRAVISLLPALKTVARDLHNRQG